MRQGGWLFRVAPLALALALAAPPVMAAARSAKSSGTSATKSTKARNALHQFTGIVTAMEKSGFTVEKSGKKPRTMVFVKHAEMKSTGEFAKDTRVTVYYRDEGGQAVAHRVVAKAAGTATQR